MNTSAYLKSLGDEMLALKDRVRYLISDSHWQTDGEWKESVVRQMLRRSLPPSVLVSRGFVVAGHAVTSQIDILLHRVDSPVIYRDGELVFLTPDAVVAIIEVKSRVTRGAFVKAVKKIGDNIALVRESPKCRALAGLISFETSGLVTSCWMSEAAKDIPNSNFALNIAALGNDRFFRYWELTPEAPTRQYNSWHVYDLAGQSFGYFLHSVVEAANPESVRRNNSLWYPSTGKEGNRRSIVPANWAEPAPGIAGEPF